jgi:hypothetical protein
MISTTLHLGNSGILQECWYLLGLADYEALGIPVCPNGVGSHDPTFIEYDNIGRVGVDIGKSITLKKLKIKGELTEHPEAMTRNFQLLCDGINENKSIEKIKFYGIPSSHMEFIRLLTPLLVNSNVLQKITLRGCELSQDEGCLLATALKNRETPLNMLSFQSNTIINLARAFHDNPGLFPKNFKALMTCDFIQREECDSIKHILQHPKCTMEELTIKTIVPIPIPLNEEIAIFFANALVGNKTLRKLDIGDFNATKDVSKTFVQTLCNTSSINATYTSNHTLEMLEHIHVVRTQEEHLNVMWQYLIRNRNDDEKAVARQKVLMHHFSGQFSMKDFEEMKSELLMRSLIFLDKWGRTSTSFDVAYHAILFHLIKNDPLILFHENDEVRILFHENDEGSDHKRRRV